MRKQRILGDGALDCQIFWEQAFGVSEDYLKVFDEVERTAFKRLRKQGDRERYLAAHALSRVVLGEALRAAPEDVLIERSCFRCDQQHGKPRLCDPGPFFSMTHSGAWVGCAVSWHGPVGVDVEQIRSVEHFDSMIKLVHAPDERPAKSVSELMVAWTRKEALLKATGHGLVEPMTDISMSSPDAPARLLRWKGSSAYRGAVWMADIELDVDHAAAVAVLGHREVRCQVMSDETKLRRVS